MSSERILIVEDDADGAEGIQEILEAGGYEVVGQAGSGQRALELALAQHPDLVLMDIQLEGEWDGVETARALRAKLDVPVLYMTAHTGHQTLARAKATVPAGYLLKPFSPRELVVAVEMALLRQQLESSLRAERERLNVTLRSIGDAVIATDIDARVVLLNSVAEQLTGWRQTEAMGRPVAEVFRIVNQRTREPRDSPVQEVLRTAKRVALDGHSAIVSRDGRERSIADSAAPIFDATEKIIGAVLVFRDVTQQLQIEEEARRAQRLESVGALAGGIAHDFNNLLAVISANVSFAMQGVEPDDPNVIPVLEDVLAACHRAAQLTQQLLTFASGGAPIRKPTSLGELVRATVDFALRGSKSRSAYEIPPNLRPVDVDPGQISQVLTNLVINADEAMPGGGVIEVRCENRCITEDSGLACPLGEYVEMAIVDHGPGIPPEVAARLFEPYFSTKRRGSGLGLATAYSIIKKHDGALTFESRPGAGTTFRVLLPVAHSVPDDVSELAPSSERTLGAPARNRVLIMDDESALRTALSRTLTDLGYFVEQTADGAGAVECFARAKTEGEPFDVVLLDLTVRAGMGGLEALDQLRQVDAAVCAIAISGYAPHPVLATPQKYGFFASLPKPFRREDLGRLLRRACRRKRTEN